MEKNKIIVIATHNPGKLKEYQEILSPLGYQVHSPVEEHISTEPDETGKTYRENALIKAEYLAKSTSYPIIADDSGIEINALGEHFPGVHSSRYAKSLAPTYSEVHQIILKKMADAKDRKAAYYCCICYLEKNQSPLYFEGKCEGEILKQPRGNHGFGYDPIFRSNEKNYYFGDCSEDQKNEVSHRGKALRLLLAYLAKK